MTLRKWIAFASAAALIAGIGACNDNKGGSSAGTRTGATDPQGRRADTPSRLRSDAGISDTTTTPPSASPTSPASPSDTSSPTKR